jgi:chloride channel 7
MSVVGGYVGSLFTSFNTWVCLVRKKWSGWFSFRVLEVRADTEKAISWPLGYLVLQ